MTPILKQGLCASCAVTLLLTPAVGVIAQPAPNDGTTVSDVQVKAPEQVPVPEVGIGAPLFTVPELEVIQRQAREDAQDALSSATQCGQMSAMNRIPGNYRLEYDAATVVRNRAGAAIEATRLADQVRRDAVLGLKTQKEVEDAELARQAVVRPMVAARAAVLEAQALTADLQKLEMERPKNPREQQTRGPAKARVVGPHEMLRRAIGPGREAAGAVDFADYATPEEWIMRNQAYLLGRAQARAYAAGQPARPLPQQFADLKHEDLTVREREDAQGRFLVVSGAIRNPRRSAIPTPPLSITVLDRFGFPLKNELADPQGGGRIRAGQAQAFTFDLRPRPGATDTVLVTFGSDEYEPWRLPLNATEECPVLPFMAPRPQEGALPSPRDVGPAALRPQK